MPTGQPKNPEKTKEKRSNSLKLYWASRTPGQKSERAETLKKAWSRKTPEEKGVGTSLSAQTKERISKALSGRVRSASHCENLSKALKGQKCPWASLPENRKKNSESKKGIKKPPRRPEHTKNQSDAQKRRWNNLSLEQKAKEIAHCLAMGHTSKGKKLFKTGHFFSKKNQKLLYYRSSYELAMYKLLEDKVCVISYDVEPVMIPYEYNGKKSLYVPDVRINWIDGSWDLGEVKPQALIYTPLNQAKFDAADAYCGKSKTFFQIFPERRLQPYLDQIIKENKTCQV